MADLSFMKKMKKKLERLVLCNRNIMEKNDPASQGSFFITLLAVYELTFIISHKKKLTYYLVDGSSGGDNDQLGTSETEWEVQQSKKYFHDKLMRYKFI